MVFRATQLALHRPVALKAIAPELAADIDYRERFQRESRLAASIDHPNVIPVYEAGELDGTLYLIMRWVEGTDLRSLLNNSGRVSPGRAIELLQPVASALAAAHSRGLVHRDVKPANVMVARGDQEHEDHVYLTDFGIARRTDGESLTSRGMFVGTIDYMAPERIEGDKGDARADVYSFGCMLFEALTGHVPFDRPTDVSKIFAHINDPIPSVRREVDGVPEPLDAIIAKAMAKDPKDRFVSAREVAVALAQVLQELVTDERDAAVTKPGLDVTTLPVPATEPTTAPTKPTAPAIDPTVAAIDLTAATTEQIEQSPPPRTWVDDRQRSRAAPRVRRSPVLWVAVAALIVAVGVLVVVLAGGGGHPGSGGAASTPPAGSAPTAVKIQGSGLAEGQRIGLGSRPGSVSVGTRNVWISLPDRGQLVRYNPMTGRRRIFTAGGMPTAIAAGPRALWVADTASRSLAQFNGDSGARVAAAALSGTPTALALDQDSSAWVADSSGAIRHVALGGAVIGTPAHSAPAAMSIGWGEGWVWAANGAENGLVRVSLGKAGSSTSYPAGSRPVAVTFDQGVWTAHANGHVTRFNPRRLRVNADIPIAAGLDSIAATEQSPFVWAISKRAMTLYRVTNTSQPSVTGTVVFGSPPIALAVSGHSVWVAAQDGEITEIRF